MCLFSSSTAAATTTTTTTTPPNQAAVRITTVDSGRSASTCSLLDPDRPILVSKLKPRTLTIFSTSDWA
jgi:hypothetical protein